MEKVSYIYLISNGNNYKVGVSVNPKKRVKQLQTGSESNLKIVEAWPLPASKVYKLESKCHEEISHHYQKRGEWFKGATEFHLRLIIEDVCFDYI